CPELAARGRSDCWIRWGEAIDVRGMAGGGLGECASMRPGGRFDAGAEQGNRPLNWGNELWGYLESNQGPLLYQGNRIGQKADTERSGVGQKWLLSRGDGLGVPPGPTASHVVWRPFCAPGCPGPAITSQHRALWSVRAWGNFPLRGTWLGGLGRSSLPSVVARGARSFANRLQQRPSWALVRLPAPGSAPARPGLGCGHRLGGLRPGNPVRR